LNDTLIEVIEHLLDDMKEDELVRKDIVGKKDLIYL